MIGDTRRRAFTLTELAVVVALSAVAGGLILAGLGQATRKADRTRMAASMRTMGGAILAWAAEHGGRLPGPLWPGQIVEYDPARPGRLVVELASHLGIEERGQPHVVSQFLTPTLLRAARGIPPNQLRVFVMNMSVRTPGGTVNPWGSLAAQPAATPVPLASLQPLSGQPGFWEADRTHPDVAAAPWAAFTAPSPPHGRPRMAWHFDGRVEN